MTTSDIETYGKLMTAMDEVVLIMTRAREYETLYTPPGRDLESGAQIHKLSADDGDAPPSYEEDALSQGRHRLLDGLPGLYAAILLFAVKVGQYFGTSATSMSRYMHIRLRLTYYEKGVFSRALPNHFFLSFSPS